VIYAARAEFRVSNVRTQQEIIDAQTARERPLAMLGCSSLLRRCCWRGWAAGSAELLGAATAVGDWDSGGGWSHRGCGACAGFSAVYGVVVLSGEGFRCADAGASFGRDSGGAVVATVPAVLRALRSDTVEILRAK